MLKLSSIGGLGLMSSPSARHLLRGDTARVAQVLDRGGKGEQRDRARAAWKEHGARLVGTLDEALSGELDGVMICAGKNGDDLPLIAASIRELAKKGENRFVLHLSTVSPAFARAAAEHAASRGVSYVNYPLTGGPKGAELGGGDPNGMLILASGDEAMYRRLEPTLLLLGRPRYFGARVDAGAVIKLVGQLLVFNGCIGVSSAAALFAEAFYDGKLQGAEQASFFDFLNGGAGGTRQWDVALRKGVADGVWDQGFLIKHAAVDALYAAATALEAGLSRLVVEPMLGIALAFSYLLTKYPERELATHALARELLRENAAALDAHLERYRPGGTIESALKAAIGSLPENVRATALLEIRPADFTRGS